MASISDDPNGRKRILFVGADGVRRSVRLGKVPQKHAEAFKRNIEAIISDLIIGQPHDADVAKWIRNLGSSMRERLAKVGIVQPDRHQHVTLEALMNNFFAALSVKPSTVVVYKQSRRGLAEFFGQGKLVSTITPLDAEKWRQYLKDQNLAQPTISKRVKTARQMFAQAVKWKMIAENPFDDVKAGSQTNKRRMYFVSREDAEKILAACPDAQWRLIFVLSRFGGLRCPSEHLALKWSDVDWEHSRIRVLSCKTEHYEGHESRWVPLFPELRPSLLEVFELANPGTEYVITRYRDRTQNLRTQLKRIIVRAGLTPWPKPFHNLRSTRQTELAEHYPIHVVCAWLGNSRAVAQDHYLQVTDAHFAQAAKETFEKAAQNPAQHQAETSRNGSQMANLITQNRPVLPSDSAACDCVQVGPVTPTGFEPVSRP